MSEVILVGKIKSLVESGGKVYVNMYVAVSKDKWDENLASLLKPGTVIRFKIATEEKPKDRSLTLWTWEKAVKPSPEPGSP